MQEGEWTVYTNPGKQELSRIEASKERMVVIRPSIKKQPMDAFGFARVEKVLVDFMVENCRFKWVESAEAEDAIIKAITSGRIDRGLFEMYRNKRQIDWNANA